MSSSIYNVKYDSLENDIIHYDNIMYAFPLSVPELNVSVNITTATSISLFWTSADSVIMDNYMYEVMWKRDTSGECSDEDESSTIITDGSTNYDIVGLEEDSSYSITVTARNMTGNNTINETVIAETEEAGKIGLS